LEYGTTAAYGGTTPPVEAGSGTGVLSAQATFADLNPATTYHFGIVAANSAGSTHGDDTTSTTAEATTTPTVVPSAPTVRSVPRFGGVELLSTKLILSGRLIALKLRCPAGTAGRCSGRARLTARRRRPRLRPTGPVTIGRTAFSIAAGHRVKVTLHAARAGRRLIKRVPRLRGSMTTRAHSESGESNTTLTAA